MFNIMEDLAKAAVGVVKAPVSLAADTFTLGGTLTNRDKTYIEETLSDILKNLENATKPR